MDSEKIYISEESAYTVNKAKDNKRNVCAVGTTVLRTLESSVSTTQRLKPYDGWTNKFIFPPYQVQIPNMMISNFHLPLSIPLMMVSAFGGYERVFNAYQEAIKEKYRFGTYGDAMLIIDDENE
jgi:S-adenosylmethionine:tRNA ribosyltransferase-isomerase